MASPDRHSAQTQVRPLGEDAPTWLSAGFAAIGLLVAGAAAWLALSTQPAQQVARSDAPIAQAATSTAAAAASATAAAEPARETRSEGAAIAPVTPPATPAASPAAPATAPPDAAGQPALASAQPTDTCPPPVHIPFKLDSATPITKNVQMDIEKLQAFMNRHSDARLSIEGHADAMGAEDYNLLLSYRRAKAAVALLGRAGLPEARMTVRAAGKAAPIIGVPGASERNRRVVLQVIGIDACLETHSGSRQ